MKRKPKPHVTTTEELIAMLESESGKANLPVRFCTGYYAPGLVVLSVYEQDDTIWIDLGAESGAKR